MCVRPVYITLKGRSGVPVSCGKCVECVKKRQNSISIRGGYEMNRWKTVVFATLTFDPEHLKTMKFHDAVEDSFTRDRLKYDKAYYKEHHRFPDSYPAELFNGARKRQRLVELLAERPQIDFPKYAQGYDYMHPDRITHDTEVLVPDKDEWFRFMKRFRQSIVNYCYPRHWDSEKKVMVRDTRDEDFFKRTSLKFLYTCEYGPNTLRPHYHMIVYGNAPYWLLKASIQESWQKGFVQVSRVKQSIVNEGTAAVVSYVAKYLYKPEFFENPYVTAGILPRAHCGHSHGLGESYVLEVLLPNIKHINKLFEDNIKGNYHGYNRDYIKALRSSMRVFSGGYMYNLPRYYKDKVSPKKRVKSISMDYKTRTMVEREVERTDGEAPLLVALASDVLDTIDERVQEDIDRIQAANPEKTFADCICIYDDMADADLRCRERSALAKLHDSYFKSARQYGF